MKKIITGKKMAILLLALILLAVGGFSGWRMLRKKETLKNENYIASNFLEMGLYPKGRSIASQALSTSPNDISRQLILLSFCYEEDFENALSYGEKYLKKSGAVLTDEIYQYALEAESSGADTVQLLLLHNKVKEQIQISTGNSVHVSAVQDILQMESGEDADTLSENLELLEGANDALSLKAKAYGNALLGNTTQAASYATQLVQADNSLSNQTAAANAIVAAYSTVGVSEDDAEMLALTQKAQELSEKIYELEEQLSELTRNGKNTESVDKKLEKANEQREEVYEEISALPARRALNYMEANKPWKDQAGYWIQLARLYYLMGEEDTAQEYINRVLSESISGEDTGYLGPDISKLLSAYDTVSGTESGGAGFEPDSGAGGGGCQLWAHAGLRDE
ncbi:MAG: hypothetical protein LUE31_12460 [Lachnospiraceae bacterium]|nr:hypothetical protein [Lachnospiraceae bacterium]